MKQRIWTETYKVTSYLVNLRGRAGLYTILNFIQDVGWQHAMHLQVKLEKNRGWVFTRQKLSMDEWPAWNQDVTIRTWLRPPGKDAFLYRDYELFLGDKKIGECTSSFVVMDMETRRLALQDWSGFDEIWRQDGLLAHQPEKIVYDGNAADLARFEVRNSDIDLNRHVNNTKYAQWILDAIPIDILRDGAELKGYEVNFLAETKIGDVVNVQKMKMDQREGPVGITQFQGLRAADGKPVFTAQLRAADR